MDWMEKTTQERNLAESFAHRLSRGTRVIDQKRAEIKELVHGLIGLLRHEPGQRHSSFQEVCVGEFSWHIFGVFNDTIEICAQLGEGSAVSTIYSSNGDVLALRHVEVVHKHLPMLVAGLMELYPRLERLVQPLLDAADNT